MTKFNNGEPYHGSEEVMDGKLVGATDTDYFYFFCPKCGGSQMLQILDYEIVFDEPVEYAPEIRPKAKRDFKIAFELHCVECRFHDFVKISNIGWQAGTLKETGGLSPQMTIAMILSTRSCAD